MNRGRPGEAVLGATVFAKKKGPAADATGPSGMCD
jgi:hypothetical protein